MAINLKQAIAQNKLDDFIKEHSQEEGDADRMEAIISSMVQKPKEVQEASARGNDES